MLMQRPFLVSSTSFYTFQSCNKMLHPMPTGCMLLCLLPEQGVLWLHSIQEQDEMLLLPGLGSCCMISSNVIAAQALTNQPCCSCCLTLSDPQHINTYINVLKVLAIVIL